MTAADWPNVEPIFAAGIAGGEATFETSTPTWEEFDGGKIRAGFRVIGRRNRIARSLLGPHAGQWRDTLIVERRSTRNGMETAA